MTAKEFKLPDVGEGVTEGELVSWLVEPGETVTEDQPVAEVETDKALVEVPSPYDGTVTELHVAEGEMVPVGTVIVTYEVAEAGDAAEAADADDEAAEAGSEVETDSATEADSAAEAGGDAEDGEDDAAAGGSDGGAEGRVFAPPSARRLARELGVDIAAVEGTGPGGRVTEADVRAHAESETETEGEAEPETGDDAEPEAEAEPESEGEAEPEAEGRSEAPEPRETGSGTPVVRTADAADRERTLATPATRRVAREAGVDVDAVPTDEVRDGEAFVTEERVRAYAEAQREAQAADVEAVEGGSDAEADATAGADAVSGERVPYRGVRRTIGEHMVESARTAPHVTHFDEVDVTSLVELREEFRDAAESQGVKLTYTPFIVRAVVGALERHEYINATLDTEAEEIVLRDDYHVGVATATDVGLMVPVVRDADEKGVLDLASEIQELAARARDRSIDREEMQGGTFTITNVGAISGDHGTPIINQPQVAILALGEVKQRPWVVDGEVEARYTLPISLSFDHRVVDGADSARFCSTLAERLRAPKRLLLE
jgi:pyruvate dehydrogenase E2 component (dihydrolipoamide acetyltransferase)